jgi:collagen type III alpha
MTRMTVALAGALGLALAGPAVAQITTGGAANTGVAPPPVVGGVPAGTVRSGTLDTRMPDGPGGGNAANRSNSSVPGTTPDVNIGGTPTSGPPGTGGAAGGPSLGN